MTAQPDLNNYKGIYYNTDNEKYTCPVTGAHFRFQDLCSRLEPIRKTRQIQDTAGAVISFPAQSEIKKKQLLSQ